MNIDEVEVSNVPNLIDGKYKINIRKLSSPLYIAKLFLNKDKHLDLLKSVKSNMFESSDIKVNFKISNNKEIIQFITYVIIRIVREEKNLCIVDTEGVKNYVISMMDNVIGLQLSFRYDNRTINKSINFIYSDTDTTNNIKDIIYEFIGHGIFFKEADNYSKFKYDDPRRLMVQYGYFTELVKTYELLECNRWIEVLEDRLSDEFIKDYNDARSCVIL
jgi:hypothetical protein